jgi:hypothetical protein
MDILMTLADTFTRNPLLYNKARNLVVRGESNTYISKRMSNSAGKKYHFGVKFDFVVNNFDIGAFW